MDNRAEYSGALKMQTGLDSLTGWRAFAPMYHTGKNAGRNMSGLMSIASAEVRE